MIVEFFGIPGGGKTTLLQQLAASMPQLVVVSAGSRKHTALGTARFMLRHPVSFCMWMYLLVRHSRGLLRYKLGLLLRSMAARAQAESFGLSHIAGIDEGMLQRILSLFDTKLSARTIALLLRMTPLPDAVIEVRGGDFSRFATASNRAGSPRVQRGSEYFEAWRSVVQHNAAAVAEALKGRVPVIVCVRGEPDAAPEVVRQKIEQLL